MSEIFRYADYRAYLKDWFEEKKKKNPAFSLRSLAKRGGRTVPHSTFWMVMRGERNLTSISVRQFVSILGLTEQEASYFEILVMFNQAKGWGFKQRQLERILEMRLALDDADRRLVTSKAELELFSSWYSIPILVILEFEDFKADASWISKKLGAPVTNEQIRSTLDRLLILGLATIKDGKFAKRHSRLDFDSSVLQHIDRDKPAPDYFAVMSERATFAYDLPAAEISGGGATLMANKDDLPLVRQRISETLVELNALLDKRPGPKELYQMSATFFPLARSEARKPKKSGK